MIALYIQLYCSIGNGRMMCTVERLGGKVGLAGIAYGRATHDVKAVVETRASKPTVGYM